MSRGINDGNVEFCSLKFPQGNVNGDTTFSFRLKFVQHPGVFEGALTHLKQRKNIETYHFCKVKQAEKGSQSSSYNKDAAEKNQ